MNFVRNLASNPAVKKPVTEKVNHVPTYYSLSSFRWHMDTRPPLKAILLHDLLGSHSTWKQTLHEYVSAMPMNNLSPTVPLEVYCPDLRGHGFSDALEVNEQYASQCVDDVYRLQQVILGEKCSLGGLGFGAMVAAQTALLHPELVSSLCLCVNDISQVDECLLSSYPTRQVIASLQGKSANLKELNASLASAVPQATERGLLLLNTIASGDQDKKLRFRLNNELLQEDLTFSSASSSGAGKFDGPTAVFHVGPLSEEAKTSFLKKFPRANFSHLNDGILYPGSPKIAPIVLHSFGILGRMSKEE